VPTVSVQIKNLPQIRAAFAQAPQITAKFLDQAIKKSALLIEGASKTRTPVRTGFLRASHQVTFAPLKATIQPTADYAVYVHQGTRFMKGRPFLFDAVDASEDNIQKFFTEAVQNALNEIADKSK